MKPPLQKKAYLLISSRSFETVIMGAIMMNTMLMAAFTFPQAADWWDEFHQAATYVFGFIFFVEFLIKLYALRTQYWKDNWNRFDFFCVVATFVGIFLQLFDV